MSTQENILTLQKLLSKNTSLHAILENEVNQTPFGTITVNIQLKDGVAILPSLQIVKQRRRKYELPKK